MWCVTFPAGPWHTNCYLVAPEAGAPCVVIDPGVGAADQVRQLIAQEKIDVAAIVATHGHIDHIYGAEELCRELEVPLWIHPDDEHLLTDPLDGLGGDAAQLLMSFHGSTTLTAPPQVEHLTHGQTLTLAELPFDQRLAPGHTAGSVLLTLTDVAEQPVTFTGDVVFAGSVGRTDLPGGDTDTLMTSVREQVLTLPTEAVLLPGHGPATTLAVERESNPFFPR